MIEVRGLTKAYGEIEALRGVDLSVAVGEMCVVLGPSGAGKSTLLRCINRLTEPGMGEIIVGGRPAPRGRQELRELLFKVSWSELEPCKVGGGLPRTKRVVHGTTLAIDWDRKIVRAVLSTDRAAQAVDDRDAFIARLIDRELLTIAHGGEAPAMRHAVSAVVIDGALRVRSTARALHALAERER